MNRQFCLFVFLTIIASLATLCPNQLYSAPPNEARITQVKNRVQLANSEQIVRRASVNDFVHERTVIRTGDEARAEVAFDNETVVRLLAHTAFNFNNGTRGLNLAEGAILVQAPKEAKGATLYAGNVAAALAGTTALIEFHPGVYKFLVLEGTARLYRPGHLGDSVLVAPGQMVFGNPEAALSDPVDFDIQRFSKTSHFITDFAPLASAKSIAAESQKQQHQKSAKNLVDTNLVIFGGGTQVSVTDQQRDTAVHKTAALAVPHRLQSFGPNAAPTLP